ncbi:MAG: lipoprotein [Alphaproteobacteria bacterium]|nr:lipoprotein [Alphaproteobacteria bacterium]
MNKSILAFAALAILAGCAHTHYAKDERYVQRGDDCIVKVDERGIVSRNNADNSTRTVYRNTHCAEVKAQLERPAEKISYAEPTGYRTVKRVYLRNNCKASYGTWCD